MSRVGLVLCGGKGTRFRSVSVSPKILAPFGSKRFLDWLIGYLYQNGFTEIVLSTGYKSEEISSYISEYYSSHNINILRETKPLGTGGAVEFYISHYNDKEFFVFNGDTFWAQNLPLEFFEREMETKTLCLTKNISINDRYGQFIIENGMSKIVRGSDRNTLYDSDIYIGISRIVGSLNFKGLNTPYSFEELIVNQSEIISTLDYNGIFIDFGIQKDYEALTSAY